MNVSLTAKQVVLKPQDLVLTLKLAVNTGRTLTFAKLGEELFMSASEVHAASRRAQLCKLLSRTNGLHPNNFALSEFIVHGVQYVFPPVVGTLTRGMATGHSIAALAAHFVHGDELPYVWPDPEGDTRGLAFQPLYASVPKAARHDERLYNVLALVDAIRGGQARDKELALSLLTNYVRNA